MIPVLCDDDSWSRSKKGLSLCSGRNRGERFRLLVPLQLCLYGPWCKAFYPTTHSQKTSAEGDPVKHMNEVGKAHFTKWFQPTSSTRISLAR